MRGTRGWIRILEATIAVMIIAGVMLVTYTGQEGREVTIEEYSESVQTEILADLVLRQDLRLAVLNTEKDKLSDENYRIVNDYVASQVPDGFGYLLRICNLSSSSDYCKMTSDAYVATLEKDVYVEETIVGAEVGAGSGEEVYSPKKVKIYFWEGDIDLESCIDECDVGDDRLGCSANARSVVQLACVDVGGCLIWGEQQGELETCVDSAVCIDGDCVGGSSASGTGEILTCEKQQVVTSGYDVEFDDECNGYDGYSVFNCGKSCFWCDYECDYECWNTVEWVSDCSVDPVCPSGYSEKSRVGCLMCSDECSSDYYYCSGNNLMRKSCLDVDSDGCLEYGTGESSTNCAAEGKKCEDGACVAEVVKVASVGLGFSNFNYVYQGGWHYYYHTRTLSESNGVGVTFTSGQVCHQTAGTCNSGNVNYRVPANGQYSWSSYFSTTYPSEVYTATYWGIDDNGNSVSVGQTFSASGSSY